MQCWSLAWRVFSKALLAWEMSAIVWWFEHSLVLPFLGTGMKIYLSQSFDYCWVFRICWCIECSTLTASSFRILNNSAGIPTPSVALLAVLLLKAHLTLHSRMSGFRLETTPSWLSESLRAFLYSSSGYSCHFFLIPSASVRSLLFSVLYCAHLYMKCSLGISSFLEEISSLSHSIVFLCFFALIT